MSRGPIRRQPSGPSSVALGIGSVVLAATSLMLVGVALALLADLLVT